MQTTQSAVVAQNGDDHALDIREQLKERLPQFIQPFITWGCGKAPAGAEQPKCLQKPGWRSFAPTYHALAKLSSLAMAAALAGGIVAAVATAAAPPVWLVGLLPAWTWFVSSGRGAQVETVHQAVHGQLTGSPKRDWLLSEIACGLVLCNPTYRYLVDHMTHHSPNDFCSMSDPDVQTLHGLVGLEPGEPKEVQRRKFLKALFSPRFHIGFLKARLHGVFSSDEEKIHEMEGPRAREFSMKGVLDLAYIKRLARLRRTLTATVYAGLPLAATIASVFLGNPLPILLVLLGLIFPAVSLYQVSALSHFVGEHYWKYRKIREEGPIGEVLHRLTPGRFYADAPPPSGRGVETFFGWIGWWTRFLLIHVPMRHFVSAASLPWHFAHHSRPKDRDWVDGAYWSAKVKEEADRKGRAYSEHWGLGHQLDAAFEAFSKLRPFTSEERAAAEEACKAPAVYETYQGM